MELSIYPCTEQELYTIADLGWNSCLTYQVNFFAFKPKYTVLYIQGKLADIEAARILPDEQTRNKEYETAHIDLKILGTQSCDKWQDLKRYIADAFDKLHLKTNLDAAGQGYYYKATHENWESVKALLNNGSQFITDNLAALTAR